MICNSHGNIGALFFYKMFGILRKGSSINYNLIQVLHSSSPGLNVGDLAPGNLLERKDYVKYLGMTH